MVRKEDLTFLYSLAKPNLSLAIASLSLATLVSLFEVATNALVLPLTQILGGSQPNPDETLMFMSWIAKFYNYLPARFNLLAILLSLLVLVTLKNVSLYFSSVSINDFTLRSGSSLRQKCIERFLELEINFYNHANSGELLSYVNEQAQRSELLFSSILELIREIISTTFLILLLIVLSPQLTLVTVLSLVLVALSLRFLLQGVQRYGRKTALTLDEFSALVSEIVSGIRVIKSFASETREQRRSQQALENRYQAELTAYRYSSAVAPVTETAGIIVLLVILLTGTTILSSSEGTTLPILLTYTLTLLRTLPRVNHLNGLRSQLSLRAGSYETICQFLTSTDGTMLPDGRYPYRTLKTALVFENVMFTYPESSEPVLQGINLRVPKGKTTAIVGSSGSGKSTLIDLITRFYDPSDGTIQIDGTDLKSIQRKSWRRAIALVSQDTFLFNATVYENIAYGRRDATTGEVIDAAKKAYAYDFIQEMPNGFDTIVGNRGARLSGGQRQRIAIARAILCDPDILILDEATSALDSNSERIVQKAIEEASRDRTVIVIAHRLSTIEKANNIVVMQEGAIAEQGTHQQLLAMEGLYYSLYRMQSLSSNEKSSSSVSH